MAANRKMPTRKRNAPTKTTRLKAMRARVKRAAARAVLSSDIISLADYRGARPSASDVAVRDGVDRIRPLAKGHSAQVMLFTGVQIVRDIERDTGNV